MFSTLTIRSKSGFGSETGEGPRQTKTWFFLRSRAVLTAALCAAVGGEEGKADASAANGAGWRLVECFNPFWKSGTLHNESVLMWAEEGRRPSAPLLFDADEIISVRDSAL